MKSISKALKRHWFGTGLLAVALVAMAGFAGSAQAASTTDTYNLGPQGSGTTILTDVGGLIPWIAKGTLPTGSILRSFSVNANLDSMAPGSDSWASDLTAYLDPAPEAPGTAALLQVGGYNTIGKVATKMGWGTGDTGPPSPLVATKDVSALNIDLSTVQLSLGNGYSEATWSGTISVTYYGPASITSFGPGATIDDTAKTIAWTVPHGTDLATLAPTFTLSSGTCVPASGVAPNFALNNPATYTVTDGATINTYRVTVTVALGTSPGTTINVNLANASGTNSLNGTAYLEGGFAQAPVTYNGTTWNEFTASPATQAGLLDSEGNPSPVGFTTVSTTGAPDLAGPTTSAGAVDVKLLKGCVYRVWNSSSGNTLNNRLTVSGLDPAKTYNLYLASAHNTPVKCSWRIGATGFDKFIANTAATRTAETWVAGDDYVVFYKVSPDATGKILVYGIGLAGGDNGAFSGLTLNGFQLVDATGFQSPENDILTFSVPGPGGATISGTNISVVVPTGTDVAHLAPTYTISSYATCSPASGSSQNFSSPVQYTVTAENGAKKVYNVTVATADGLTVKTYLGVTGAANLDPISNLMANTPSAKGIQVANIDYHGASFSSLPGSPGSGNFSILWDGWFDVTQDGYGDYTFGTSSDDGSVIYLDLNNDGVFNSVDELIVNNNRDQGDTAAVGTVTLNMDSVHIVIGYYQGGGGYDMRAAFKKGTYTAFGSLGLINGTSGYFYASQPGPQAKITSFGLPGSPAVINSSAKTISWTLPSGVNPATLAPEFTLSPGATCNQTSGAIPTPNLGTGPVQYKVVSSDNLITNMYTVTVTVSPLPVVAGLARWFDASTITGKVNGDSVTAWADLSGNGANATVPSGNANPTYVANAGTASGLPALHFAAGSGAPTSGALQFARDSGILTVFSVFKGSSFLLTDANNYDFHRPTDNNPASPLWDSGNASPNIRNGSTYVNGTLVDGTTYAMPTGLNNGFNLVEVLTDGNSVQADSFNKDRVYHSGDQYQAEVIIYNQVLTEDERVAVERYLNTKWLGVYYSLAVTMDSPYNNQGYPSGSSVTATATAHSGTPPYTVTFYQKTGTGSFAQVGSPVAGAGPTFTKALGSLPSNTYQIYATVTDSAGPAANATSTTNTFIVQPPVATTTTLASSVNPSTYGQSVTFTATVSPTPSGGTVQFYNNGVALGSPVAVSIVSGQAQVSTSLLGAGSHSITANYSGFSFYAASSTAAALTQTVTQAILTVTADNKIRPPGTANPVFTYKITGYQNGENLTSAGVAGAPVLGTVATPASPEGTYPITNVVGTLTAANYSFTAVPGTLTVMVGAVPVGNGLACWYDASVGVTNGAGGGVSAWRDLSGNGHLATQASGWATNAPNEINSRSAVQIRGSGTWLNCAGKMFTKEQYVVVRSPNPTWNGSGSFLARASADFLTVRASSYNLYSGYTGFWDDQLPAAVSRNGTPVSSGKGTMPRGGFELVTITDYMILKITVNDNATAANLAAYPYYQIGRNETLGSCDMDIAEIIGYETALSSEDEFAVTSFLGAKYGIVIPAYRWKGPNNGNWSVAGNWNSLVPGAGNVAVFSDSASAGATVKLDTDVTLAGLTFNNHVANQTIAPTTAETLTLDSGTAVASSIVIEGGSASITAAITAPQNFKVSGPASATLNLYGAITTGMSDGWDEELIIGPNVVLNGTASWTSTGARYMTIGSPTGATLTINDNATIDWSLSWDMFIAWNTGDTGKVVQNGGTVRTPAVGTAWFNNNGPGVQLGGASDPVTAEYDLNGGTLITPNVYNVNGLPLAPPTGSAVFRFNGGVLQGTQNDNLGDPDVVQEGSTNLMGNLTHAYVGNGGAKIDTAGYICGMGQALEHDPGAAATDGGLTKLNLGTLTLYKACTYTGPTKVQGGTLVCATATSLAATPLEIASGAMVDLAYTGTRTVPSLKINGVAKAPGVYGASTDPTYFGNSTGTVTVGSITPPTPTLPPGSFTSTVPPTFTAVPTVAGYTYWLTYKDSLSASTWTRIGTGWLSDGSAHTFIDTTTPLPAARFYRLEAQ